jgi:superfamily I DNA/RNA helicase
MNESEMSRARTDASEQVVNDPSRRKLIVAGPGTGKTYTFRRALEAAGGGGLALTFIRSLVRDLESELADVASVFTFHGFCKYLVHRIAISGITSSFDFYPPFPILVSQDLEFLGHIAISREDLEARLHDLALADGVIAEAINLGNYYNASSFIDLVYRVLRHLETNPQSIPSYPLVVVDEYQDFSRLETSFISLLAKRSPVLIAGDDDQALYTFKHASASYIRELALDPTFHRFELPFCSRCPRVIVDAVKRVVNKACSIGRLSGRLEREYVCFLPDKRMDSERHPSIIHAHCSVDSKKAPYVGKYVAEKISAIPDEEILESRSKRYPAALIIGPGNFVKPVQTFLSINGYPQAKFRESSEMAVDIVEGYARIARDPGSRLGWRIVMHGSSFQSSPEVVTTAMRENRELATLLPDDFRTRHLKIAGLVQRLMNDDELESDDEETLVLACARPLVDVRAALTPEDREPAAISGEDSEKPSIICTTLTGSKGLSGGHVFILGFNDGHFPRNPEAITDDEVCKLIVGLSRTRQECHLVSVGRYAGEQKRVSSFLDWIEPLTEYRNIDKFYWK